MKNTLLVIMSALTLSACSEVGSKAWCEDMREKPKASGILKTRSTSPNTAFSIMKSAANLGAKIWMKNPKVTGQPKKQVRTLNIVFCEKGNPRAHLALGNNTLSIH